MNDNSSIILLKKIIIIGPREKDNKLVASAVQ